MQKPESLCFEGGGVKGIAYCGCLKALEEYNMLSNLKGAIGTSAGSAVIFIITKNK